MERKYLGGAPNLSQIAQTIPSVRGFINPTIEFAPSSLGDTVYIPVHNLLDPRVLQSYIITLGNPDTIVYSNRHSAAVAGWGYTELWVSQLYRLIFDHMKFRTEPQLRVIGDMIDTIADVSRMLGIYLTALTLANSLDPEMLQRARIYELNNTFPDMMAVLATLPCPPQIVKLALKYIRLFDTAGAAQYQNCGFISTGGYRDFLALYENVKSRSLAMQFLRTMYGQIGNIGDPGNDYNADVFQAFINCGYKLGSGGYTNYIEVDGNSGEAKILASFGILHSTFVSSGTVAWGQTGYSLPGVSYPTASQRVWLGSVCRWNGSTDAAITRTAASQTYSTAAQPFAAQTVLDAALAANLAHEYNMMTDSTTTRQVVTAINTSTGTPTLGDTLSVEDTQYRISPGFKLTQLNYSFGGNFMAGAEAMLMP